MASSFKPGVDYELIDNTEPDYLDIESHIRLRFPDYISCNLHLVGSFGKKKPGNFHKDLDYIITLKQGETVKGVLDDMGIDYIHYPGLRTFAMLREDQNGIMRKVDIFDVEDIEFAYKAFYSPQWYQTKFPSSVMPMLLNSICRVKFMDEYGYTSYSPATGLRKRLDKKFKNINQWETITTNWATFKAYVNVGNLDRVEDIIATIRNEWPEDLKQKLEIQLKSDRKLVSYLESHDMTLEVITDNI